jgi:hypothetical protein
MYGWLEEAVYSSFLSRATVATVLHMSKASYHLVPSAGSDPISYSQTEISVLDIRGYLSLL